MVSNFKGMVRGANFVREERLKETALKAYKRCYYGLTSFLHTQWREAWKELNPFKDEKYFLAPGKRLEDGSYSYPEIDWDLYNADRQAAWDEFMESNGMPRPVEVMTRFQLETALQSLVEFCQENWEVLPPFEGWGCKPDSGEVTTTLTQINYDNLKASGKYTTQEAPQEMPPEFRLEGEEMAEGFHEVKEDSICLPGQGY